MKVVILCGGKGTRLREETEFKPKPLVEIGHRPMLWHIMKIYSHFGFNDFILTLGYKGEMIKDYFLHQRTYLNNFTLETKSNQLTFHNNQADDFRITFVETGLESLTGERVRRVKQFISDDNFMVTYGDGVADIDIRALADFHQRQQTLGTICGVHQLTRFGVVAAEPKTNLITEFHQTGVVRERENGAPHREPAPGYLHDCINGGFMVFQRNVLDMIKPDSMIEEALIGLAKQRQLSLYVHPGQWKCMDTYRDVEELNSHWVENPFWKIWN